MTFPAGFAGQIRQILKCMQIIGAAVRVAGIVDGIHTQHKPFCATGLSQAETDCNEHRVSPRHVCRRNHIIQNSIGGNGDGGIRQGGTTPGGKVDGNAVVFCQAKVIGNCGSGVKLSAMALSLIKGQSDHTKTILFREGCCCRGVQTSREQGDGRC